MGGGRSKSEGFGFVLEFLGPPTFGPNLPGAKPPGANLQYSYYSSTAVGIPFI